MNLLQRRKEIKKEEEKEEKEKGEEYEEISQFNFQSVIAPV